MVILFNYCASVHERLDLFKRQERIPVIILLRLFHANVHDLAIHRALAVGCIKRTMRMTSDMPNVILHLIPDCLGEMVRKDRLILITKKGLVSQKRDVMPHDRINFQFIQKRLGNVSRKRLTDRCAVSLLCPARMIAPNVEMLIKWQRRQQIKRLMLRIAKRCISQVNQDRFVVCFRAQLGENVALVFRA